MSMSFNTMIIVAGLVMLLLLGAGCAAKLAKGSQHGRSKTMASSYTDVDVDEFQALIADPAVQLLDVRTLEEFAEGHIAGAVLVDVNENDFVERATAVLDKQRPVAVYCRSGRRSARAANLLTEQGYQVTNLSGGVMAWSDAGKALVQ